MSVLKKKMSRIDTPSLHLLFVAEERRMLAALVLAINMVRPSSRCGAATRSGRVIYRKKNEKQNLPAARVRFGHGQRFRAMGFGQWPGTRRPGAVWPVNRVLFLTQKFHFWTRAILSREREPERRTPRDHTAHSKSRAREIPRVARGGV